MVDNTDHIQPIIQGLGASMTGIANTAFYQAPLSGTQNPWTTKFNHMDNSSELSRMMIPVPREAKELSGTVKSDFQKSD